ncbi:MAG TPA: methylmalonyl-CoA mutase family protein [Steroidobacteraceae bacterium]|nr:methylmalonyl-CoA mutase family protein [Steroidobacteraceae bacterium]
MAGKPAAEPATAAAPEGERILRFVSAASLFDGHDAAINMIRRLLQAQGAEVIHLGHNRSVAEIVAAVVQEDADAVAVSSYQGGHNEYFAYLIEQLRAAGCGDVPLFVGGGGTIAPDEIAELEAHGVAKVYTPEDGRQLGLTGMVADMFARVAARKIVPFEAQLPTLAEPRELARAISVLEGSAGTAAQADALRGLLSACAAAGAPAAPVIGITGTGGAGKSSLTDELLARFTRAFPARSIAVVAMDPTRRRSGGALLGDRIRMNSLASSAIFMRSLATRRQHRATSAVLADVIALYRAAGFALILVETAGIGQSDSEIADFADVSLYVMTAEYGAASQLEKIDMLELADFVVLNKAEKRGARDSLRDVRKQWRRNHPERAALADEALPVFPTVASRFNDPGVNRLFAALCASLAARKADGESWRFAGAGPTTFTDTDPLIPAPRVRYLAEIAEQGRTIRARAEEQVAAAARACGLYQSLQALADPRLPAPLEAYGSEALEETADSPHTALRSLYNRALAEMGSDALEALRAWPARVRAATQRTYSYEVRGRAVTGENYTETSSGLQIPKLAVPGLRDWGETLRFLLAENLPGAYPYTAGVYPYRREQEDPTRMFAGEGAPERTNRRFHYLARDHAAARLSTAFDSTTLYGEDPDTRPDIYGRTGNSGVSIATLDDMKKLYSGFDLCKPSTSVSMTINGPAPMLLAMFMNTAIDQRAERHLREQGVWEAVERQIAARHRAALARGAATPQYHGELPPEHDGSGLALLGMSASDLLEPAVYERIKREALQAVRGTVQADILKEDQAQNTCIFSTEFALRMMGDVQEYFSAQQVRNFYSVSVSGYHIAEAGANPVTQLAFTLANGFTLVEYYLARGMRIDDFAPNLSFFFSNGMDAEYAVIGRVARRIWARAMRERYGASARSQMLKYHVQTSGRSLHAREIAFNDIRTTLQALYALLDNCNSLHTNAYDEALTTPTEESVRRAVAIQLIINRELGLNKIQNPWQGSYAIEALTDLVESAVYAEFEAISERGGVLGAMETMYQRGKIQDESMQYELRKHDGTLPIIGVNTFLARRDASEEHAAAPLFRSTEQEKQDQVAGVRAFQLRNAEAAPAALARLQAVASGGGNVFAELMETVKTCSLGQITHALYSAGGQYRRSM